MLQTYTVILCPDPALLDDNDRLSWIATVQAADPKQAFELAVAEAMNAFMSDPDDFELAAVYPGDLDCALYQIDPELFRLPGDSLDHPQY